jgi:hypothetical protein
MHRRIDQLERDHTGFRQTLDELLPRIDALSEYNPDEIESVCGEISELLDRVDLHDKHEIELLQECMWFDEGGEG